MAEIVSDWKVMNRLKVGHTFLRKCIFLVRLLDMNLNITYTLGGTYEKR